MGWIVSAFLLGLILGHSAGWDGAHRRVAAECQKLGRFYVKDKVFHCTEAEK
ncbi:MAG: hypothetical protein RR473_13850 [Comamonas sp.]